MTSFADLHDTVIQQLFAVGLSLEATARRVTDPQAALRIHTAVDDLDATIKRIRSTIFALGASALTPPTGPRDRMLALAAERTPLLSCRPRVLFDGPVDSGLPAATVDEIVTVCASCSRTSLATPKPATSGST